ncbi:MAG: hypothetical protein D6735_07800 [Acidobacteria bacterium]|nr:MAG: hypothetical protein D6735_07800 [Acidobacteriota bacterium]
MEDKICPLCQNKFACGAKDQRCWCFSVSLDSSTLKKLNQQFSECLCLKCLSSFKNKNCQEFPNHNETALSRNQT